MASIQTLTGGEDELRRLQQPTYTTPGAPVGGTTTGGGAIDMPPITPPGGPGTNPGYAGGLFPRIDFEPRPQPTGGSAPQPGQWDGGYWTGPGPRIDSEQPARQMFTQGATGFRPGMQAAIAARQGAGAQGASDYNTLNQLYRRYQNEGGQWQNYGVRSLSMDYPNVAGDPWSEDNVSTDDPNYMPQRVRDAIAWGIVRPEDAQLAKEEFIRTGGELLYSPGVVRTFGNVSSIPNRGAGITGLDPRLTGGAGAAGGGGAYGGGYGGAYGGGGGAYGGGWNAVQGPPWNAGRQSFSYPAVPNQFDDPLTARLENVINQQLTSLEQPQANPAIDNLIQTISHQFTNMSGRMNGPQSNPALERLNQFLDQQFSELSQTPGYSPEELAIMRTQMLEPIERDRAAGRNRVLERTAARGMLPSSGLNEQDLQMLVDRPAEERRVAAQRDLAINAIDQRRNDLNQAMQVGQVAGMQIPEWQRQQYQRDLTNMLNLGRLGGIEIPGLMRDEDRQRRNEALQLASLGYELPGRALQESLAVINGSPGPDSLFNQAVQLENAQRYQQQLNQNRWLQIAQLIAGLDF